MIDLTKLSPAAAMAVLKDHWQELSDVDLFDMIKRVAVEFAKGSPDGEAFHTIFIMTQLGLKIARPHQVLCPKCGKKINVNQ